MSSNTTNLNLYKANPVADPNDTFNIDTILNANWDKIDLVIGLLSSLNTTNKTSLVNAINEILSNQGVLSSLTTSAKTSLVVAINELLTDIGTLSSLSTTIKVSLVLAINELVGDIGTLTGLSTTTKINLVAAINELLTDIGVLSSLTTNAKVNLVAAVNEINSSLSEITKYPACRVYNNTNISLASGSYASLPFNSEDFDTDNIHDVTTNNTRLTCNTAGVYLITVNVSFFMNATGSRSLKILLNGSTIIGMVTDNTSTILTMRLNINTIYKLSVGDYIEIQAYQDSGSALNVPYEAKSSPAFGMVKVG